MAKITYMPTPADRDVTEVSGITFPAYVAVDVPDERSELIAKLDRNPWFTKGNIDEARQAQWAKVRGVQSIAQKHRDEAARHEREAEEIAKAEAAKAKAEAKPVVQPAPVQVAPVSAEPAPAPAEPAEKPKHTKMN